MRDEEGNRWEGRADKQDKPRRSFSGPATDKPVKTGEEYDVTVEAVGSRGDGIAKVNNFVVFVPGGQANQAVHVRITAVHERFATAEIVTVA
ncbi:MAG: TRAM domain-containing protein [Candidatus Micrarchaeia archaeon]|jgi:predicted RNA-binding protein with TRAM domain